MQEILTISEAAKMLRVSILTLKRWGKKGILPAIRINSRGDRRYKLEDIKEFIRQAGIKDNDLQKQ